MPMLNSYDGTRLHYRVEGTGEPLICLPGGPGRSADYLGTLGSLSLHRQLTLLDPRGTGLSDIPPNPGTYRCSELVRDVEELRSQLGLERVDVLSHSAAGNLAMMYAAQHPRRVRSLVLVAPGLTAVGIEQSEERALEIVQRRSTEPWYPAALAGLNALISGDETPENRLAAGPLWFGRWDAAAERHTRAALAQTSSLAREGFSASGAFDARATRGGLLSLRAPVLVYVGGVDPAPDPKTAAELVQLFPDAALVVQDGAGHTPWLDDPDYFTSSVMRFYQRCP